MGEKDFPGRSCLNVMLSQKVWVSLRLCISKKFQVTQVLLALTPPSKSQGMRKPAGQVGQLVCEEGLLRK